MKSKGEKILLPYKTRDVIKCACGCGRDIVVKGYLQEKRYIERFGVKRYIHGHSSVLHKGRVSPRKDCHQTLEAREKIRQANIGRDVPLWIRKKISSKLQNIDIKNWKSFTGFEPHDETFSDKFKREVRKRDNQICMNCGVHREKVKRALSIHHINYDKKCSISENCICLCDTCHSLTLKNRPYWQNLFQDKLSKLYNYKYKDGVIVLELE